MKNIFTVTKKELKDNFISPIAYVVLATFLIIVSIMFVKDLFVNNQANMRNLLTDMNLATFTIPIPLLLIFLIPAFTMKSWAEEKKEGTLELIMTQPITKGELIIGKLLSSLSFILILLILTIPIPITLNILGNPDNGVIIASYIGLFLLSATYITIGHFISINTQNQIVAFIVSVVFIGILYIFGESWFLMYMPNFIRPVFEALGLGAHFRSVARGVIDSRDILYYLSIIIILFMFIYRSLDRITKEGA